MSGIADALGPVGAGLGILQAGIGIVEKIGAKKKINNLLNQREAYKTPKEIYDVLNATQSNAQSGFDPTTLNYLTTQTDNSFSSSLDTAKRLGADPNAMSAIFTQKIDAISGIASNNHQLQMQNFSTYLNALNTVADNKAAEFKSQQDIVRDKLQSAGANLASATGNISNGINTALGSLSAAATRDLYNTDGTLKTK